MCSIITHIHHSLTYIKKHTTFLNGKMQWFLFHRTTVVPRISIFKNTPHDSEAVIQLFSSDYSLRKKSSLSVIYYIRRIFMFEITHQKSFIVLSLQWC